MRRVASLHLPQLAIERLRRVEPSSTAPPERHRPAEMPLDGDPGACSVPRGGGWRPGARWARTDIEADIAQLPTHRRPPMREPGRRSEAAAHPFRAPPARDERASAPAPAPARFGLAATRPLVLTVQAGRQLVVAATCPAASSIGVGVGMPVAQARAFFSDLDIRPHDTGGDADLLRRLALHAVRHWTPIVMLDEGGILLDLTGTTHLFGGEERFCRRALNLCRRVGLSATVAIADTAGAAHGLARSGTMPITIVPPGRTAQAIAPLPVSALRLEDRAIDAARRFGLVRVADLLGLPRAPLARRLGQTAIKRLDQALGRVAEPFDQIMPDVAVVAERRLLEPISTAEALDRVASDLVNDMVGQLREHGQGARTIRLTCVRVDAAEQHLTFGTARATRDEAHLLRLIRMRIPSIEPRFGIEAMLLQTLRMDPLPAAALGLALAGEPAERDLSEVIDQLAGRVGSAALFRTAPVESDVPERAVARIEALAVPGGWPGYRRPTRLLATPERLSGVLALLPDAPPRRFEWRGVTHRIIAGDGPERIHGEWWHRSGEVWGVRDYFRVEDEAGARFWLFRRGDGVDTATGDLSWFMHGLFG